MRKINHSSRFIEMFGNAEKTMPLSDCIGITFPGEWGEDDSDGTGVKVIRTTNFTNSGKLDLTNVVTRKIDPAKIDKKHLIPGDIILERSGGTADNPVGRVVYFEAKGTFLFNNFTQLLRCKDGVNNLFVFYSLYNYYHTHKSEIRSMGNKTTGIQNLKMDKYWDIPIADASHEQQDQFVSLYKQADKSKFSDFKSRFIEMFRTSQTVTIGSMFETTSGGTPSSKQKEYYDGGTIPWLTSGEVAKGKISDTAGHITELGLLHSSAKWVPVNTVVIAMYGATVGKVGLLTIPCTTNQAICSVLPKESVNPLYLYHAIKSKETWMSEQAVGAAQPNISQAVIRKMKIPMPCKDLQDAFVRLAEQADKSKFELKQAFEKIDKVMRALLQ